MCNVHTDAEAQGHNCVTGGLKTRQVAADASGLPVLLEFLKCSGDASVLALTNCNVCICSMCMQCEQY